MANESINVAGSQNGNTQPPKRRGRSEVRRVILDKDPTANYQSTRFAYYGELFVQNIPLWRLWTARLMLTSDPIVNFSMNIRNAALMAAEVRIKAAKEEVAVWAAKQWDTLWNKHRSKLVSAKKWGFAALQCLYKVNNQGLIEIADVKDFAPEDCRALELDSKLVGMRVKDARIFQPQALWITFGAEFGSKYGVAVTRRQYPAWFEKWMDHGAKRLMQLRMIKDAYIGDIFWYPPNINIQLPDGKQISWRDMMREVAENRLSGAALTLPRLYDSSGKELTGYTPPQQVSGITEVFAWVQHCDDNILKGADIPLEVVQAASTGSGYSGRSIPFLVLLNVCNTELIEVVQAVTDQVLRPLAWLNWGGDPELEILPVNLVESFSRDVAGSPLGGSGIGSSPQNMLQQQQLLQQLVQQQAQQQQINPQQFAEQGPEEYKPWLESFAKIKKILEDTIKYASLLNNLDKSFNAILDIVPKLESELAKELAKVQLKNIIEEYSNFKWPVSQPPKVQKVTKGFIIDLLKLDPDDQKAVLPVMERAVQLVSENTLVDNALANAITKTAQRSQQVSQNVVEEFVTTAKNELTRTLKEGLPQQEFIKRVKDLAPIPEHTLETIFRTTTMTAVSDAKYQALQQPLVVDAFPYIAYYATRDARVRKEHLALESLGLDGTNIYAANDPTIIKFLPPWDYNCRCNWIPMSVDMAAKKGVKEAQEWLNRAEELAKQNGGSSAIWLREAAPKQRQYVTPPPFEPNPDFKR